MQCYLDHIKFSGTYVYASRKKLRKITFKTIFQNVTVKETEKKKYTLKIYISNFFLN